MVKPIIAIDVDDVLADEKSSVMKFINEHYNLNFTHEDYDVEAEYWGYWEQVWGLGDEEGAKRYEVYVSSGVKATHYVLPHALEVIAHLKKRYDLVVITARDKVHLELTHEWLDDHFPDTFSHVAFVHIWSGDKKASKAAIAQKLNAQYLIDDNAGHCELADAAGLRALLFGDYGWNRSKAIGPRTTRVKDWLAVKGYFDGRQLQR